MLGTAAHLVRSEGLLGLYSGLAPAVLRHLPYTGKWLGLASQLVCHCFPV